MKKTILLYAIFTLAAPRATCRCSQVQKRMCSLTTRSLPMLLQSARCVNTRGRSAVRYRPRCWRRLRAQIYPQRGVVELAGIEQLPNLRR